MKRVLIISYFFPPCNLTAGQRVMGWANHLKKFGYEPIIVTRNWDVPIEQPKDILLSSGNELKHIRTKDYEAYYLPYKANHRDRIYTKTQGSKKQVISKIFTLFNLIRENFSIRSIPHSNLYFFAQDYMKKNPDINHLIVSGNPFNTFYFGYLLKKNFNLKWLADYRDDWNTSELPVSKGKINSMLKILQKKSEKKWVGTADFVSSVSPYYVQKISQFVGVQGHLLLNGYESQSNSNTTVNPNTFTITYNGSLYASQSIEPILEVIAQLIKEGFVEIRLRFPGLAFDPVQAKRVLNCAKEFQSHVEITERIEREKVIEIQQSSDLLLMVAHNNLKGIPSSKLYEYIGLKKLILLYPSDHDIISETLNETKQGVICDSKVELYDKLKTMLLQKRKGNIKLDIFNNMAIESYSRENQAKRLAEILHLM